MTTAWKIEPDWLGETVAVLASGPSMSKQVAEQLRQYKCIVVNHTHKLAPWADMLVALDLNLPLWADASDFAGIRVCGVQSDKVDALYVGPMYERVQLSPMHNIEILNSGLAAIRIAERMGASTIILAGFDPELNREKYPGLVEGLTALIKELAARGIIVERYTAAAPATGRVFKQRTSRTKKVLA